MRPRILAAILATTLCLPHGHAAVTEQRPAEVDHLVADLSSDDFSVRERATQELWKIGREAVESLRAASRSEDPETAIRASQVLEKVELHITPDTPAEILNIIRRYREAPQNQRMNLLNELKRRRAYFQVLRLYSMESSPEVRTEMIPLIRGVAISGAREAIGKGEPESAVQLLEMSANTPEDLMALACLYRNLGRLDAQLENPRSPANVPTDLWKITLFRAKGDLASAAELAASSKQLRLLAGLKVLMGDPTLWLQQNGLGNEQESARASYVDVALKRWQGQRIQDQDYAPLIRLLGSTDPEERAHGISSLAALGYLEPAEKAQAKASPSVGFAYYLSQERIPDALAALGLDPQNPDYDTWVADQFNVLMKNDMADGENDEVTSTATMQLTMMAAFLEGRGLDEQLTAAFTEPLRKFAAENESQYLDLLRLIFQSAPQFFSRHSAEWAGDDEERWSEIFVVAFGEEEETSQWINWIRQLEPEISHLETLDVMAALQGIGTDPRNLYQTWLDKVWKAIEGAEEDIRPELIQRLIKLAVARDEAGTALKAWDMLEPGMQASVVWSSIDQYLSAADRWDEAVEILESSGVYESHNSPELHAYLAAHLRRAGQKERAREHDEWAEKLALGYAPSCVRIASFYSYSGDQARAAKWFQKAAFQADPSSPEFLESLLPYANSLMEQGEWAVAASCHEALLQVRASPTHLGDSLTDFSKLRLNADLAKAMAVLPEDRDKAVALLAGIHRNFATDGVLADDFFPYLRKAGLTEELRKWFYESWKKISLVVERYPASDNTRNTAAWLASRAGYELDLAEDYLDEALNIRPNQAAYLDTMAEVHFARGDRKEAVRWGNLAVLHAPHDGMIRKQHQRFRSGGLPGR